MPSGTTFEDLFPGHGLDTSKWLPHHLPAWSSRATTRASLRIDDVGLSLDIPVEHPLLCPGDHQPPLRISGIQSGGWSGPVGTPYGQQRFR